MSKKKATILTPQSLKKKQRDLPESWRRAKGVLKGVGIDPVGYQKKIRAEWGEHTQGLE